jgi:hypothetical protein
MSWFIPFISAWLYWEDGKDHGINYARHLIGVPIAIILWDWRYAASYALAGFIVYGDNSWVAKLVGRKGARIAHGAAFGIASLDPWYAFWTTAIFWIIFELAENDVIQNPDAELSRGFLGTLLYLWR